MIPPRLRGTVLHVGTRVLATVHGEFEAHLFQNLLTRGCVLALTRGEYGSSAPLLARVHSACVTSESYGSCDCDCAAQLDAALARIARAGRGVIFYLMQEGRGAGFVAKARDRMLVQASGHALTTFDAYARLGLGRDHRHYEEVGPVRDILGIAAPLILLTNNPDKTAALAAEGIVVAEVRPLYDEPSPFNLHYLEAKSQAGHALAAATMEARAELPEAVDWIEPFALPRAPSVICVGSYLLPIRSGGNGAVSPHWFRLHAYFDLAVSRERVVLTYGDVAHRPPLVRLQRERLIERFPLTAGGEERRRWEATVGAFVRHGAGCAVMESTDAYADFLDGSAPWAPPASDAAATLLEHHVPGRRVRPVVDGTDEDVALGAALARHAFVIDAPLALADGG